VLAKIKAWLVEEYQWLLEWEDKARAAWDAAVKAAEYGNEVNVGALWGQWATRTLERLLVFYELLGYRREDVVGRMRNRWEANGMDVSFSTHLGKRDDGTVGVVIERLIETNPRLEPWVRLAQDRREHPEPRVPADDNEKRVAAAMEHLVSRILRLPPRPPPPSAAADPRGDPSSARMIILKLALNVLTLDEIAEVMGVEVGTIRAWRSRLWP
jgi:hypothetical protein